MGGPFLLPLPGNPRVGNPVVIWARLSLIPDMGCTSFMRAIILSGLVLIVIGCSVVPTPTSPANHGLLGCTEYLSLNEDLRDALNAANTEQETVAALQAHLRRLETLYNEHLRYVVPSVKFPSVRALYAIHRGEYMNLDSSELEYVRWSEWLHTTCLLRVMDSDN